MYLPEFVSSGSMCSIFRHSIFCKGQLLLSFLCLIHATPHAQTDSLNLIKYWKFRHAFVEDFVKIGPGPGESLPAGARSPGTCVDNVSEWRAGQYGTLQWGDGMIRHGHYLSLLATEYQLKRRSGLDLKGIKSELYYALEAINRLDLAAEPSLNGIYFQEDFYSEQLNGFYLREDIPAEFWRNWEDTPLHAGCVNSANYENNNVGLVNDPSQGMICRQRTSYQNVPSLDQLSSVMVGLYMVCVLVENEFVQPDAKRRGFYLLDEASAIFDRIIGYSAARNWQIIDVNGWPVGNGGGDLLLAAPPLLEMANRVSQGVTSFPLRATRRLQHTGTVQYCLTGYGVESAKGNRQEACNSIDFFDLFQVKAWRGLQGAAYPGTANNQDESVFMNWQRGGWGRLKATTFDGIWKRYLVNKYPGLYCDLLEDGSFQSLPWPLNRIDFGQDAIAHYNNTIVFNLGVISGWWDSHDVAEWAFITRNRELELINAILHGNEPAGTQEDYRELLNSMPVEGGYRLKGSNCCPNIDEAWQSQENGWGTEYRWINPDAENGSGVGDGIFSGLDYMVLHNLYYLLFSDRLPPFEETTDYPFADRVRMEAKENDDKGRREAIADLNRKLAHLPVSPESALAKLNHLVADTVRIGPGFQEYTDWGISTVRYLLQDALVLRTGALEVVNHLTVISGRQLTITPGGSLEVLSGSLKLESGAVLDVFGELRLGPGVQLILFGDARVIFHADAVFIAEENAILKADSKARIYSDSAVQMDIREPAMRPLFDRLLEPVLK